MMIAATTRGCRRLCLSLLLGLWASAASAADLWQGTTYPPFATSDSSLVTPTTKWLVLDSGGSGGSFGKGDARSKLYDVSFWNRSLGWTCGYGGVFKTVDGGHTWARMLPKGNWRHVEVADSENIWLLEGRGRKKKKKGFLKHSTDGGKTWSEKLSGKLDGYNDLFCFKNQCWVLTNTAVWHSSDGGERWGKVDLGLGKRNGLSPSRISVPGVQVTENEFPVFILGATGTRRDRKSVLLRSDDSGQSWKNLKALPQGVAFETLFFANSRIGWTGGKGGKLWRTTDGGETWQPCHLPTKQGVNAMWFDQTGKGFVALVNNKPLNLGDALFETRDGGRTWTKTLDGAKQINRFYGLGPGQVWFVGDVTDRGANDLVGILKLAD